MWLRMAEEAVTGGQTPRFCVPTPITQLGDHPSEGSAGCWRYLYLLVLLSLCKSASRFFFFCLSFFLRSINWVGCHSNPRMISWAASCSIQDFSLSTFSSLHRFPWGATMAESFAVWGTLRPRGCLSHHRHEGWVRARRSRRASVRWMGFDEYVLCIPELKIETGFPCGIPFMCRFSWTGLGSVCCLFETGTQRHWSSSQLSPGHSKNEIMLSFYSKNITVSGSLINWTDYTYLFQITFVLSVAHAACPRWRANFSRAGGEGVISICFPGLWLFALQSTQIQAQFHQRFSSPLGPVSLL